MDLLYSNMSVCERTNQPVHECMLRSIHNWLKSQCPALPRQSRGGLTHTTVAHGTPLLESLVGKPRGKATDPLNHANGSVTLLLPLGRKAHVHDPTRAED